MTSYFSIFVLMVGFTMGINILVGAFVTSPDFAGLNKTAILDLQLNSEGAVPESLKPQFNAGTTCIDEEDVGVNATLIGILCNPTRQTLTTTTINNVTTTSFTTTKVQVGSLEDEQLGISDFSATSIDSIQTAVAFLSGDFIFRAIGALFVDDIANIPQEFIIGWKIIIGLMYAGLILSIFFGRSLANAN